MTVAELIKILQKFDPSCEVDLVIELSVQQEDALGDIAFSKLENRVKMINKSFDLGSAQKINEDINREQSEVFWKLRVRELEEKLEEALKTKKPQRRTL